MQAATSDHELLVAVRDIDKAIADVRNRLPFVVDADVLGDAVCELADVGARLAGLKLELLAQADVNGVPASAGVRTMSQFVGATTAHSPVEIGIEMSQNRWLRDFPEFCRAANDGVLTRAHIRALRKLDNVRTSAKLSAWQDFFVQAACEQTSFESFLTVCESWFVRSDPDGEEPKDQIEKNSLKFALKAGGRGTITADVDALTYASLKKAILHESSIIKAQVEANGGQVDQEDMLFPRIEPNRTESGRRVSALFALVVRGYARDDGSFPAPLLNMVMSQKVAEWAARQLRDPQPGPVPVDPFDIDGRCELIDGTIVHPLLVAAMCGFHRFDVPTMRRYVLNAKGRIVDYSYSARIHPEHLRTASLIEHRGQCSTPGCKVPHEWLEMDHNHPDSKGGETALYNTGPMCGADNRAKGVTTGHVRWIDREPPARRPRTQPPNINDDP